MTMYYSEARALMDSARDPDNGKPLQNNTRLYEREARDPRNRNRTITVYAVRLHSTHVVTIYPDFWELRANGWITPTTQSRINAYAPGFVGSNYRGDGWMLPVQDATPEPARGERTVPHPFNAADPGPEPVKSSDDCIAGTRTETPYQDYSRIFDWSFERNDPADPNLRVHVTNRALYGDETLYPVMHTAGVERIEYSDERYAHHHTHGIGWEYKQCPHCRAFDELHDRWSEAMHGSRWGRAYGKGWELYSEMLETFGSREAWLEAAREDLRQVKADNAAWREWYYANHVPFFDGVRVDHEGRVTRKQAEAYFKVERRQEREYKRRAREHEARLRHQRHLARLRSGYEQRREARAPRFERIATEIVNDIRDARTVLKTMNDSQEVTQNVG